MSKTLRLHFPEFPDMEKQGEPCRGLADDTGVGTVLYIETAGVFVIREIEGDVATLMLSTDWHEGDDVLQV